MRFNKANRNRTKSRVENRGLLSPLLLRKLYPDAVQPEQPVTAAKLTTMREFIQQVRAK